MPSTSVALAYPAVRRLVAVLMSALTLIIVLPARAQAADIALAWDAPADADIAGYIVEYGTAAAPFSLTWNVGNQTVWTFSGAVAGTTYVFRVRAYNAEGILSDPSDPVSELVPALSTAPPPATTSCVTADPFASMGGGTCYEGGWLPPGMSVPGTTTTTAPAPTTVVSSPSTCTTPDPFAGMGGGTCYNGGWLPPGMSVPGGSTAPAPAPSPAPAPAPTAPVTSSPSTCTTPNPFAAMGGGTCYNGGWLPPGMPIPGGGTAPAPTPSPAPTPAPAPSAPAPVTYSTASCTTADPFAGMGGGTCFNGGWLPPGMPVPGGGVASPAPAPAPTPTSSAPPPSSPTGCTMPDPFASIPGMVGYCRDGGWVPIPGQNGTIHLGSDGAWEIIGEDGVTYSPAEPLDAAFQLDGLRVFFGGVPEASENGDALFRILAIAVR